MELTKIRGINEKREKDLINLGITDTCSLIKYFPRRYIDLRQKQMLKDATQNDYVLTTGKIISEPKVLYLRRINTVKIICEQEGLVYQIIWFNQPYVAKSLKVGQEYLFYGRVKIDFNGISISNPSFELCEKSYRLKGIVPQYALKTSLTQKVLRDSIQISLSIEKPISIIPYEMIKKYELSDLFSAYKSIHNPNDFNEIIKASNRIATEEYFSLITAFRLIKGDRQTLRQNKYYITKEELNNFILNNFNFEFTDGQKKSIDEIYNDMTGLTVMNRLLQGDVGSGKTAVAICAVYIALKSGYQASVLAPTEVLARQNYEIFKKVLNHFKVELLIGSLTAKQKTEIKKRLISGEIDLLIGTHAVLTKNVVFKNFAFCVCDEQQRFGVAQRNSLVEKGCLPDVLVMSATPIPRTLSLIFYGDLDISTIKEKPRERIAIQTNIVPTNKYDDMLKFIEKEIQKGNQCYFVAPKIEGDEEGSLISVTELYNHLIDKMHNVKIGLLHGKMKEQEKSEVMEKFKNKQFDILVSTTVIEVGIDIKDATIIVIQNSERFGLSQLHQLRGRVGRSDKKSYCFLLTQSEKEESLNRLNILVKSNDGFKISEYDYNLRGSGDFFGKKQSGKQFSDLNYLNYETSSIFLAKKISDECFEKGLINNSIKDVAKTKYEHLKDISLN